MGTVLVADPSGFNRRFIRAAATRCGAAAVHEAATIEELERRLAAGIPDVIVVDPAIEAGRDVDLVALLERTGAAIVFFSPHDDDVAAARALGFAALHKDGLLYPDALESAIRLALDHRTPRLPSDEHIRRVVERWAAELRAEVPPEAHREGCDDRH